MATFLRFALLPVLLLGLATWSLTSPYSATEPPDLSAGLRHLMLASALKMDSPADALHQNAARASMLARTTEAAPEAEFARLQARASVAALCDLNDAATLPWRDWFMQHRGSYPDLAHLFFVYGCRAQTSQSLEWAKELDVRTTPTDLRIAVHQVLWQEDPMLAKQRGQRLVLESPRGNEFLHARFVTEVLSDLDGQHCEAILLAIAHREGLESRARTQAIQSIIDRDAYHLAADMVTLYRASTGDLLVRKRGLKAALELDPQIGKQALLSDIPDKAAHPGLYNLVRELRRDWDLPPLP
jgi:hypothetical protein